MRRFLMTIAAAGALLLADAATVAAQSGFFGARSGGSGFSIGVGNYGNRSFGNDGNGYYNNGFNNGYYNNGYGYNNGYNNGFNNGYYNNGFNNGYGLNSRLSVYSNGTGFTYSQPSGYSYSPYSGYGYTQGTFYPSTTSSYYPSTMSYSPSYTTSPTYYTTGTTVGTMNPQITQASYASVPTAVMGSMITVQVPTEETQLWFGDVLMSTKGTQREFMSPNLESTTAYTYTLKARWLVDGQSVERQIKIDLRAGENSSADFRTLGRELGPTPLKSIK